MIGVGNMIRNLFHRQIIGYAMHSYTSPANFMLSMGKGLFNVHAIIS